MSAADAHLLRRRFLILRALRWLPTGLIIPVFILILLDRGLTLGQVGLVTAVQGGMVFLLELPTGGLADAVGRRQTLLLAGAFDLMSVGLLIVADSVPLLVVVMALQGVYRALESGPLDAWYVDAAQAADPDTDIESGLSGGGVVLGIAIAVGTLASGGLVAWAPIGAIDPLLNPVVVVLVLRVVEMVAITMLMTQPVPSDQRPSYGETLREVPTVIADAVRMVRASHVLLALVAVEFLWGFGMIAFETYTPAKMNAVLGSADQAAALLGPTNAGAWVISAAGAAMVPLVSRRISARWTAILLRLAQGVVTVGIGVATGPVGVIVAYVLTLGVHGAANPVHQGLLHRAVTDPTRRATVLSANSLTAHFGGAVGGIALGALADATSLTTAISAGAAVLAVAAPLYLIAPRTAPVSPEMSVPA
ncbi:MAG: MFS transporter [Euzebya sp.]